MLLSWCLRGGRMDVRMNQKHFITRTSCSGNTYKGCNTTPPSASNPQPAWWTHHIILAYYYFPTPRNLNKHHINLIFLLVGTFRVSTEWGWSVVWGVQGQYRVRMICSVRHSGTGQSVDYLFCTSPPKYISTINTTIWSHIKNRSWIIPTPVWYIKLWLHPLQLQDRCC